MPHLDEGTIHAWLDGALDATQAEDVADHVRTCQECAGRVSEVRGLIAAATRIVSALDDLPVSGTIPPAAGSGQRTVTRWLRLARPLGYAMAATLVIAVGTIVYKQPGRGGPAEQRVTDRLSVPPPAPAAAAGKLDTGGASLATAPPAQNGALKRQPKLDIASAPSAVPASASAPTKAGDTTGVFGGARRDVATRQGAQPAPQKADSIRAGVGGAARSIAQAAPLKAEAAGAAVTNALRMRDASGAPACYSWPDGGVVMLDTGRVIAKFEKRAEARDAAGIAGHWQRMSAESVVVTISSPERRVLRGVESGNKLVLRPSDGDTAVVMLGRVPCPGA